MSEENRPTDIQIAYRKCFGGPSGEETCEHLIRVCGVFSINKATDPLEMARNEGTKGYWALHTGHAGPG